MTSSGTPSEKDLVFHRIGGGYLENLRLKEKEQKLSPPGISVLRTRTPEEAVRQMCQAFPKAKALHAAARTVGSASAESVRNAGFDVIPAPSKEFPNHFRIIHREGIAGFTDASLERLAGAFVNTTGH